MNQSGKFISGFLIILLLNFLFIFPKIVLATDSLKIALILKGPNQNVVNTFLKQLTQTLDQCSYLEVVHLDSNLLFSVEPSVFDTVTINSTKQQHIQGLVLSKISNTDSTQTLSVKALTIDMLLPDIVSEMKLSEDSLSNKLPHWNDSTLIKIGQLHHANMVLSGQIDQDKEQDIAYYPYVIITEQNNSINDDIKSLSGKTCQFKKFFLPLSSINNLIPFHNFLSAYFLIQDKKYSEAIEKLKNEYSMPGYFYLAESYLNRAISKEHTKILTIADLDSSITYFKKCLPRSGSLWDSVCVNNNLGVAFQMQGQLDSATVYFNQAKDFMTDISSPADFIRVSNNLGNIYLLGGQWNKALDIFQTNLETMEQLNDSLNLAATYENLGNIYQLIMQRDKAITYYTKALEIRKLLRDESGMVNSLHFLGDVYHEKNEFAAAKEYFRQSLTINQKLHNEPRMADSYDRLGQVFQASGELDSALFYFQKSVETFEMLDDKMGLVQTIHHQASVHQKQKDFEKAISLYERAIKILDSDNSKSLRAHIYDRMGDIYNNQDNLILAIDYYQQSADLYEQIGNFETLSLILYNMGLIKLKQNDYAEGYQLLQKAVTIDEEHGFNNLSGEKDFLKQLESILGKN